MDLFFPQRLARYDLRTSDVDHWCKRPRGFNISAAEWKNIAIPLEADGRLSQCRVYERCMPPVEPNLPNRQRVDSDMRAQPDWWYNECLNAVSEAANDTREIPCEEWEYDDSVADSTAVSTWDLVCHRRLIRIAIVALQYAGAVLFLVTSGMYADSLSRRRLSRGVRCSAVGHHGLHLYGEQLLRLRSGALPCRRHHRRQRSLQRGDPVRSDDPR
ncbi:hypothetical protein MTO96_002676 [Rhipicephalus appendiculatus]